MATKKLSKIKSGVFSRGLALAKLTVQAGANTAGHAIGKLMTDVPPEERFKKLLMSQAKLIANEFGQLKGSVMKIGQLMSMYGEHFLPPEANDILKSLQSQSPPLEWEAIRKVLVRQLGVEKLSLLEIDPEPLASASLGQVHRATRRSDGLQIALKIQYPGVDKAIDQDLKAMKSIFAMAQWIPKGPDFDEVFKEIRMMLHLEVDYEKELLQTKIFKKAFGDLPGVVVPEVFEEFSTARVLATSFESGVAVDSPEVKALSQERRNKLGETFLHVYFRELFLVRQMQTDPHFGNYRVRLGDTDQLVLLDFGAVRKIPKKFLRSHLKLMQGAVEDRKDLFIEGSEELGFLEPGDEQGLIDAFFELCQLIVEPFRGAYATQPYPWAGGDLPQRVAKLGGRMALNFQLRAPPREVVFLDRKMGGVFIFLSALGVEIEGRSILDQYIRQATVSLAVGGDEDGDNTASSGSLGQDRA